MMEDLDSKKVTLDRQSKRRLQKLFYRIAKTGSLAIGVKLQRMLDASGFTTELAKGYSMEEFGAPLVLAIENGHLNVVKYLIEKCHVSMHIPRMSLWGFNRDIEECTALHVAVISGRLEVVDYLLKKCKENVNSLARVTLICSSYSYDELTPLHFAVSSKYFYSFDWRQHEIIRCLLHHGADWTINNKEGEQCWELTSDVEITKLLIDHGIGLKSTNNKSSTNVLHKWALSTDDRACEVIDYAISKGADLNETDRNGLTPLLLAATGAYSNSDIFQSSLCMQNSQSVSRLDKINALELMGATCINEGKRERGLRFWETAMDLRFNVANEPAIPKPPVAMSDDSFRAAFQVVSEVQNLEELEDLRLLDHNVLNKQAHLTYIRILGMNNIVAVRLLYSYAISKWETEKQDFLNYSFFIIESCDYPTEVGIWNMWKDLVSLSIVTLGLHMQNNAMLDVSELIIFANAMSILRKLVSFLQQTSDDHDDEKREFFLDAIVHLTYIMVDFMVLSPENAAELECCLNKAIRLEKRTSRERAFGSVWDYDGSVSHYDVRNTLRTECYDLLLLACTSSSFNFRYSNKIIGRTLYFRRSVSHKLISLLLKAGAQPNSRDHNGNTTLHILARNPQAQTLDSLPVTTLLKAGAHIDTINNNGDTMLEELEKNITFNGKLQLSTQQSIELENAKTFPTLQCLCARTINSYSCLLNSTIPYSETLPKPLVDFVELHSKRYRCACEFS